MAALSSFTCGRLSVVYRRIADEFGVSVPLLPPSPEVIEREWQGFPSHGGQGRLLIVNVGKHSPLANRLIADVLEQFPDLLAVAIIRDQQVQLPRGSTRLASGDQMLIAAGEGTNVERFSALASGVD